MDIFSITKKTTRERETERDFPCQRACCFHLAIRVYIGMDHSIFVGALSSIRMRAFGVHVHVCVCEREAFFALVHISRFCHGYLATWAFLDVSLNLNRFRG